MKIRLAETAGVCCLVGLVLATTSVTSGQVPDPVTRAKALYAEAAYDEALVALKGSEGSEAHQYRALCLIALGRTQDAERALESLVAAAPTYTVSSAELPPRMVAMFEQTRKRVMPALVKKLFTEARADFQARNMAAARDKFEQVLVLAGDPVMASSPEAVDLQLLVGSYIDIVKNSAPSSPAATPSRAASAVPAANISQPRSTLSSELFPPAPASVTPAGASAGGTGSFVPARPTPSGRPPFTAEALPGARSTANDSALPPAVPVAAGASSTALPPPVAPTVPPVPAVATPANPTRQASATPAFEATPAAATTATRSIDTPPPSAVAPVRRTLVPAITVRQNVPAYTARNGETLRPMSGAVRVSIGADGKVTSAVMEVSLEPRYDARLLSAARSWVYKPATLDGQPIDSEKIVQINIAP